MWRARFCYAHSEDGIHFEKPSMGQVELDGLDTNVLEWKVDADIGVAYSVIRDDEKTCRFRFIYTTYADFSGLNRESDVSQVDVQVRAALLAIHTNEELFQGIF